MILGSSVNHCDLVQGRNKVLPWVFSSFHMKPVNLKEPLFHDTKVANGTNSTKGKITCLFSFKQSNLNSDNLSHFPTR